MNNDIALRITNVSKEYRLGQIGSGTLYRDLQSWFARKQGKEDPNLKIGQRQRLSGESFLALNGINLEISKGEAVGIIGRNGAGKSTLLKLLSQVTGPTTGEIELFGRISSMLEVGTGFNGEMTGRENVYLNGAILGMTRKEIDSKMDQIIKFSEVGEFIDTPVKRYSSGMYVKLAFSVAAHLDSEIMIMDEVLAVGDVAFQKKCLDRMRVAATEEGRTVLYVSHNMDTIRRLCDRCIVLHDGKVVYDGDVEKAVEFYTGETSLAPTKIKYEDKNHPSGNSSVMRILEYKLLNRDVNEFVAGDVVEFAIKLHSFVKKSNYLMNLQISKGATPIGVMFNDSEMSFEANEEKWVKFSFDTSGLTEGQYIGDFCVYLVTEYGSIDFIDGVTPGFLFRIIDADNNVGHPMWKTRWGAVRFPLMPTEYLEDDL